MVEKGYSIWWCEDNGSDVCNLYLHSFVFIAMAVPLVASVVKQVTGSC